MPLEQLSIHEWRRLAPPSSSLFMLLCTDSAIECLNSNLLRTLSSLVLFMYDTDKYVNDSLRRLSRNPWHKSYQRLSLMTLFDDNYRLCRLQEATIMCDAFTGDTGGGGD